MLRIHLSLSAGVVEPQASGVSTRCAFLLNRMCELMREERPPWLGMWSKLFGAEDEIVANSERAGVDGSGGFCCAWSGVDTNSAEVMVEQGFEAASRPVTQRVAALREHIVHYGRSKGRARTKARAFQRIAIVLASTLASRTRAPLEHATG
jgi:hypothetical protein